MNGGCAVPSQFDASGVFETCRVKAGKVLWLEEHLRRLRASLKTVNIGTGYRNGTRYRGLLQAAARDLKEGYIRIAVRRAGTPRILIHAHSGSPYSERQHRLGIHLRTVPTRWPMGETAWAQAKTSERLGGVLARIEAAGAPEVLRLGPRGEVTEGTVSNLFFMREGALTTAPTWAGVLEGVTRAWVIRAARKLKIPVQEIPFSRHELFNAEEAFLTNVLMEILPVREVDGRRIGGKTPGPVTRRLMITLRQTQGDRR